MKIHNIEQGTPEWLELRKGKMTASHAQAIGNNGKGLETYVLEMMAETYSSAEKEQFTNEHMERGNELEPQARGMYELKNDCTVEEVGFVEYNEYAGMSPDGLVGDDGLIEIKCMSNKNHFNVILNGLKIVSSSYIWQIQMQLLIAERKWCDLICYNPNFEKDLILFRIEPDKEKQEKLLKGINKGIELIKDIKNKLNQN